VRVVLTQSCVMCLCRSGMYMLLGSFLSVLFRSRRAGSLKITQHVLSCGQQIFLLRSLSSPHDSPRATVVAIATARQRCTTNETQALPNRPHFVLLTNKQCQASNLIPPQPSAPQVIVRLNQITTK
jgi:hypothetical protein